MDAQRRVLERSDPVSHTSSQTQSFHTSRHPAPRSHTLDFEDINDGYPEMFALELPEDPEARKPPMLGATLAKLAAFYAPSLKELVGQLSDQPDARRWYQWMRYGIEEVYS